MLSPAGSVHAFVKNRVPRVAVHVLRVEAGQAEAGRRFRAGLMAPGIGQAILRPLAVATWTRHHGNILLRRTGVRYGFAVSELRLRHRVTDPWLLPTRATGDRAHNQQKRCNAGENIPIHTKAFRHSDIDLEYEE